MKERQDERFDYRSLIKGNIDPGDVYIELEFLDNLKGKITDISLKGVGFEIDNITSGQADELSATDEYFIKICINEEFFLAGVRNRWHVADNRNGKLNYRGGVEIHILSPSDSVRLSDLIQRLRVT